MAQKPPPSATSETSQPKFPVGESTVNPIFREYKDDEARVQVNRENLPKQFLDKYKDWGDKLPEFEKKSIRAYTGLYFEGLNTDLRKCPAILDCLGEKEAELYRGIQGALETAPKLARPITVYRGVGIGIERKFMKKIEQAQQGNYEVSLYGITSTSMSPATASGFGNVVLELKAKTGAYVDSISANEGELEFIQDHNTEYRVTKIIKDAKVKSPDGSVTMTRTIVQMEQV